MCVAKRVGGRSVQLKATCGVGAQDGFRAGCEQGCSSREPCAFAGPHFNRYREALHSRCNTIPVRDQKQACETGFTLGAPVCGTGVVVTRCPSSAVAATVVAQQDRCLLTDVRFMAAGGLHFWNVHCPRGGAH